MKKEELKALCDIPGISGHESGVRDWLIAQLASCPAVKEMKIDPIGNLLVWVKGSKPAQKRVLFSAHMDEVGLIVTHVTEEGYLALAPVGGLDPAVVYGHTLRVNGYLGVVAGKALHQCHDDEDKKVPPVTELLMDVGAYNKEEAGFTAAPGDPVTFDNRWTELGEDLIKSKALDDRMGCLLLLELIRSKPEYDIMVTFVVQEEVGLRGATVAGHTMQPDIAVVVETTTAADLAGVSGQKRVCEVGKGPVVSFMDGRTLYDAPLYSRVRKLADDAGIPNQTKTMVAGGNDAGAFQQAGGGVQVTAVSLACRYLHSPACVLSWKDGEDTLKLLTLLANTLPAEA